MTREEKWKEIDLLISKSKSDLKEIEENLIAIEKSVLYTNKTYSIHKIIQ